MLFIIQGFDWRLEFFWEWLPASDRSRKLRDPTTPVKTPAIAGGLFAVDRAWFQVRVHEDWKLTPVSTFSGRNSECYFAFFAGTWMV